MSVKKSDLPLLVSGSDKLTWAGKRIVPWAIKYRNDLILTYIKQQKRHLDLGCGNGYLVYHSPASYAVGLDKQHSYEVNRSVSDEMKILPPADIEQGLQFEDNIFDIVTCAAVLEHLDNYKRLFSEVSRVLREGGSFIITTPSPQVNILLPFLDRGSSQFGGASVHEDHKKMFSLKDIQELSNGLFDIKKHNKFQFGLNNLFVLIRK